MTPVETYREGVRHALRADTLDATLGLLIFAVGLCALLIYALRQRNRDSAVAFFSIFALLYGIRLLLRTQTIPFLLSMPDGLSLWLVQGVTYVIPIPAFLFGYMFVEWRRVVRWLIAGWIVFAVVAIAAGVITKNPGALETANNLLTLVCWVAFAIAIFRDRRTIPGARPLRWGLALFGITVIAGNLRSLGLRVLPFDPEPLGFACFLGALAYLLALRAFRTDEQLRQLNKELEIATRIQLSILPAAVPESAGLKIAAQYLPMTAVAGDFYDFLRVDERRIGILIADVSGHGVPAALIASMVKVAIAAQLPHAQDPALVLSGMNRILCGKMQGQFVSAAYLFLDLEAGLFRYAAGGHPPLLWWQAGERRVARVEENGLLLGIMPLAPYTAIEHPIGRRDRFLLYTDGLAEAANAADEFFGEERLGQALAGSAELTGAACVAEILKRLRAFAGYDRGGAQDDDLTVLVIDAP